MFNHSQRVDKTTMSFFFKSKMRGCGARFGGKQGCHGTGPTPEQRAARRDWLVNRATHKLLLNAEQKPLLAALLDQMAAHRQAMVGQTTDLRAELRSWFAGDRFDAARAQALINDKASALQSNSPATLAALAAFYDSLNPAQQQKLRDFMDGGRRCWFGRRRS